MSKTAKAKMSLNTVTQVQEPQDYLTEIFIQEQRFKLLQMKEKIVHSFKNFREQSLEVSQEGLSEEGDMAQNLLDQKMTFSLRERDLKLLREIELALTKIDDGSYGICEECGDPIEKQRLEKQPWARLSLYYAELEEREHRKFLKTAY